MCGMFFHLFIFLLFIIVSVQEYRPIYLDIGIKKEGSTKEVRGNLNYLQ